MRQSRLIESRPPLRGARKQSAAPLIGPLATPLRAVRILFVAWRELRMLRRFQEFPEAERKRSAAPQRFVETLLGLGPAFVKLGQILSTRPDFMPDEYIRQLAILHERVPAFSYEAAVHAIEEEFQRRIDDLFVEFDTEPVAAASLAQVHLARLHGGAEVAVKIQRPGVKNAIERDMRVLSLLIRLVSLLHRRLASRLDIRGAFTQFEAYTHRELDFHKEAETLERFRDNFRDWPDVIVPRVFREYTTPRVLTMQRVQGLRLHEVSSRLPVATRNKLNERLMAMLMKMFVSDGFFHADLHPGNIFFGEDATITLLDVGMVGRLTEAQRNRFLLYWLAVSGHEKDRAFDHLCKLALPTPRADTHGFRGTFDAILDDFFDSTVTEKSWTQTFLRVLAAAARFGFRVPSGMLLEAKALTTAESLASTLCPEAKFTDTIRPFVCRELAKRSTSGHVRRRLQRTLPEWLLLGEAASPSVLNEEPGTGDWTALWQEIAKVWTSEIENHPHTAREEVHGEYTVEISEPIDRVFNFVSRLARYEDWHPTYTDESKVIHVGGEWIFLAPEVVGSVFRLDEIADGYYVQSNGVVTEFERNRRFKWRAPLSLMPLIHIGTCFTVRDLGGGRTSLHEYFYFLENDLTHLFKHHAWLGAVRALEQHIKEELTGVKTILESGQYDRQDADYLWENITSPTRVARNYLRPAAVAPGPRIEPSRFLPDRPR